MTTARTSEILRELCNAHGVSGYEDDVRSLVENYVRPLVHEIRTDALGSLIAMRYASTAGAPVVMLDAHLDEIGMVVSYVESSGFLRFALVGGWDERVLPAHSVDIKCQNGSRVRGVIGVPPPHIQKSEDRNRPYAADNLFIDVGAVSRDEVEALGIAVGDSAVPYYPFYEQPGGSVIGKALDNRAGCTTMIRTLEHLFSGPSPTELPVTIAAVFSTFEETGARGAAAAAFGVDPKVCLVLEGTVAGDFPGVPPARNPSRQGAGPAITLMDRTAHCPRHLVKFLQDLATAEGIPHQLKTPIFGGTNAARIQMSRAGILTGIISVPCRYIHSPHATLRLEDLESTITLATAFAKNCNKLLN